MGATNSHIKSNVKQQIVADSRPLYQLVSLEGGGTLVSLMKETHMTKNLALLDNAIQTLVRPFLYDGGKGRLISKVELVKRRRAERSKFFAKLATYKPGTEEDETAIKEYFKRPRGLRVEGGRTFSLSRRRLNSTSESGFDMMFKNRKESGDDFKGVTKYKCPEDADENRYCCWNIDERGTVGETILHLCLLNGSPLHLDLAKRILRHFPNMAKDIYIGDEYYGESILHMAVVCENPALLKVILDCNPPLHDQACGNFFCADDQKEHRNDFSDHEYISLPISTNFLGKVYWGDLPLSFAACLNQEECVRLLLAKGADPNRQDSNGNTAMHMMVIKNNKSVFDLLHENGADLRIKNRQGLTPFTLAAHTGNSDMFEHILKIERQICWNYGPVLCAGYPLKDLDTIDLDGNIDENSALYKIVHGKESSHLGMMDGMVEDLLTEKWETFIWKRLLVQFLIFLVHVIAFFGAVYLRPAVDNNPILEIFNETLSNGSVILRNLTEPRACFLLSLNNNEEKARVSLEVIVVFLALMQVMFSIALIIQNSFRLFIRTIEFAPSRGCYTIGCILVLLAVPGRIACASNYEDVVIIIAIISTCPHFLFFCRAFKHLGPFVVMVYKMIKGDLFRFFLIAMIFVSGFSQSMYVCFRDVTQKSQFQYPFSSFMGMFIITLSQFENVYEEFDLSKYHIAAKALFLFNMVLCTILLINMLIAMMVKTYESVKYQEREWLRQWSQIILVVEFTTSASVRLEAQRNYTLPLNDDAKSGRQFIVRFIQEENELEEIAIFREQKRLHEINGGNLLKT